MSGLVEFLTIAWPGLLVLAGFVALIAHAAREHRRRHPHGRWRVRFEGPRGILTAEHELTEQEARQVAEVARRLVGEPLTATARPDAAWPDATASAHARGLHRGEHADPDCLHCAIRDGAVDRWPDYTDAAGMYRSRRYPGRAG
jgi:hypothetical protein